MRQQNKISVGLDHDSRSIRAVKLSSSPGKNSAIACRLLNAAEVRGDFTDEAVLVEGLRKIREKMSLCPADSIVTCVSGKQTYAAQVEVRKVPDEEMAPMIKLEIRKTIPFEVNGSTVGFHPLSVNNIRKSDTVPVIVSAVVNSLLHRHLRTFENAGLRPCIVDVLPLAVANAFWIYKKEKGGEGNVILHVGPESSTLVIDGDSNSFFNRSIHFNAHELFADQPEKTVGAVEADRRMEAFCVEIIKSLSFYESEYQCGKFSSISLLGNFVAHRLCDFLNHRTGLDTKPLETVNMLSPEKPTLPGKYELAAALAMRAF